MYVCMYAVKKRQTMCPPIYYQSANGPMVTHALGHMKNRKRKQNLIETNNSICTSFLI